MYQLGADALKVSMKLFAFNRQALLARLKKTNPDLPKSSIILLQGGKHADNIVFTSTLISARL